MPALPLEDNFDDILNKALRGLKISSSEAAEKAGLTREQVEALTSGRFDLQAVRQLAPVLDLNPEALAASGEKSWQPDPVDLEGLAQFNTPWDDMAVNAYVAWDPASLAAVVFDTGADASPILDLIQQHRLQVKFILLTHGHGDHVFDLDRLKSKTGAPAWIGDREPLEGAESFSPGRTFTVGRLQVQTRLTWGHSKGGITYVVSGLARQLAVVGDAVFAGSMGGGMVSYPDALATNRAEIFTLSDDTVICPGHGPLTTVGEEKKHNPFYAGKF
jgi:glyoxylase-like metal-dependent hydrolase (beta-lactamase superfamily II)